MLMSRLALLLVHSRKINLSFLLVKRPLKPRPSGEVRAVYRDGEDCGRTQFLPTVLLFLCTNP